LNPATHPIPEHGQDRQLFTAGIVFAVGSAIHVTDHLRRGQGSISDALYALGNAALVLQVVVVTLIMTRHRLAPLLAATSGFPLAVGFTAAHWMPRWSALSDPVWRITSAPTMSYVASTAEIIGALLVGITGLRMLRSARPAPSETRTG